MGIALVPLTFADDLIDELLNVAVTKIWYHGTARR